LLSLPVFCFNNEQPTSADIKDFSPQSSEVAPDFSDEKKSLSFCGPKNTGKRDAREHGLAPKDEKLIQSSSSKSAYKGRHGLKSVKVEVVFYALFFYILYDLSETCRGQINL
jgi:hypothetical protein